MYQLLTGYLPFGKLEDQNDLVRYQKRGKAGEWDRTILNNAPNSAKWMQMMEGCLQPDYKKRLQTVDAVLDTLPYDLASSADVMMRTPIPVIKSEPIKQVVARLKVAHGLEYGKVYNLDEVVASIGRKVLQVGRDEASNICLVDYADSHVSRRHFTMEKGGDGSWLVRDGQWVMEERCWRNSSNGTYLNSTEVSMSGAKVSNGDIITVGDIKLIFELE